MDVMRPAAPRPFPRAERRLLTLGHRTMKDLWREYPYTLLGLLVWLAAITAGWITAVILIWEKFGPR